ncbi:alpha-galactosidase [Clostridium tertium]|jgi:alpha-galactosidase|uniref:alpha-galactosidase n=1 Tax=Clostridium tertium TaxID=1559 RepID=UPI000BE3817C|nr:alpha-galactosidase [Clostridium tertium]MBU6136609.1 alpha-galactosidase [Clostridium tertium]MDB1939962.1 alpha-galactosidase [Clostridium tertium]MDB1946809.1 alpha-galactosidase [Clostridium tertium]MDB1954566.1 alpha-galactosidase [Clostridium tertium]MDB1959896.1 alpha-galactosidase [Clostridium tertium]
MGIRFIEKYNVFKLDSKDTSYIISIVDEEKFLGHVYFGKKVIDEDINYLMRINEPPYVPSKNNRDRVSFYDSFPFEYSTHGIGDFRESSIRVIDKNGHSEVKLEYKSHEIYKGKKELNGLPATFGDENECTSLEITCEDMYLNLQVVLVYTTFENLDVITRSVKVKNLSEDKINLTKVLSTCIDFDDIDYDMISLHGSWARERHVQRKKIGYGKQVVSTIRGESSHQDNPFIALLDSKATDDYGNVYGFNFVYSGNFFAQIEGCQFNTTRVVMGINPEDFNWLLNKDEEFIAPEVVMVYSNEGIGKMTRTFHDLYRNNLIRGEYKDKKRPILINNWEATYFDFNTEKLLSIAKEASKLGIEMLVMDDGWFGKRNADNSSLGDWFVNEDKISGGLNNLVDEVNKLGMEFGIWVEPEMISGDSELFRKHPDWCIKIPGREPALCREQYVLDLSRKEILDYIYDSIKKVLSSANITYVKWDMNRQLTDLGSLGLKSENQGELLHRYVLAVYDMMDRLTKDFPHILLENCSGGGARFDPGMLYYSPQIWCSDDTDAIERLKIQEGTSMVYPLSAIGAHVSDCPNHTVGRTTPFETRGYVALAGTFGYELDVTRIPEEDRDMIPEQIEMYHKYNDLVRSGDYYRIQNFSENNSFDAWSVVSKDKSEVLVTCVQVFERANYHSRRIKLKGLIEEKFYKNEETGEIISGGALMTAGINLTNLHGDFKGKLIHLKLA